MPDAELTGNDQPTVGFRWPLNPEWLSSLSQKPFEIGAICYQQWLATTSRLLEDQANHLKNLSECNTPADFIVYQTEFAEKSFVAGCDECRRIAEAFSKAALGQVTAKADKPAT